MLEKLCDLGRVCDVRWALLAIAIGSLAAAGCGLGDYEEALGREQARLTHLEEEQRKLTFEISLPKEPEPPYDATKPPPVKFPTPFYYRPPLGIDPEHPTIVVPQTVYEYPLVVNTAFPAGTVQKLCVAATDNRMNRETFFPEIVGPQFLLQQFSGFPQITVHGDDGKDKTFNRLWYPPVGGTGAYYLYHYEDPVSHWQVAICYKSGRELGKDVIDNIEYSLRSLALGNDANVLMSQSRLTPRR